MYLLTLVPCHHFTDVRILQVITVASLMQDNLCVLGPDMFDTMPMVSMVREWFFLLQLFKEQMFSMDEQLELYLASALAVNRKECCENKKKYAGKYDDEIMIPESEWNLNLDEAHFEYANHSEDGKDLFKKRMDQELQKLTDDQRADWEECKNLAVIWWHKFEQIRKYPNERQCVKFDRISDILKRFFMEHTNERDIATNKRRWTISFEEILTVYPNVEELHFINEYRFDDGVLQRFMKQIKRKDNTLRKVVFLYFDYAECDQSGKPMDNDTFLDPERLDRKLKEQLAKKCWRLRHQATGKSGYKIILQKDASLRR